MKFTPAEVEVRLRTKKIRDLRRNKRNGKLISLRILDVVMIQREQR